MPQDSLFGNARCLMPSATTTIIHELKERLNQVQVERRITEPLTGYPIASLKLPALLREEADIIEALRELEG